jgi:low temperature requirement protein LtrA
MIRLFGKAMPNETAGTGLYFVVAVRKTSLESVVHFLYSEKAKAPHTTRFVRAKKQPENRR